MKTWNIPELRELSINATAGGPVNSGVEDGPAVWDPEKVNPATGKKGAWWTPSGSDDNYHN